MQGFLDSALVVGSFHVIDHMGEEGLERAVGTRAAVAAANACTTVLVCSGAALHCQRRCSFAMSSRLCYSSRQSRSSAAPE